MRIRIPTLATILAALFFGAALAGSPGGALPLEPSVAEAGRSCPGAGRAPSKMRVTKSAQLVRCLVNKRRAKRGLKRLKKKKSVTRAATAHTKQMRSRDCFAHQCPGEPALPGRLSRHDYLPCNCSWSAGETLAYGKGRRRGSPKAIVKAWMNSSTHRSTILGGGFEHVGVGVRRGSPYKSKKKKYATYTLNVGYKR